MSAAATHDPGHDALLERDVELAELDGLIDGAAAGRARVALVEGPAGIGKTRLLGLARTAAKAAGLQVLTARGGELEREFAFGVVRQLFEPVLMDEDARETALAGAAATAGAIFASAPDPAEGEDVGDTSFAMLHGLHWTCVNLSESTPLLLAVDDLHWCDRASLRFLVYLARRLEGLPLLVLGGLRPNEPGADAELLGQLAADPLTVTLRPGPLSGEAVAALVSARLGAGAEPAFAAACRTATGGNPLLLSALLSAVEAENVVPDAAHADVIHDVGPRAVSRSVLLRLARLPPEAVRVAQAAAVLGDGADLTTVAALAGLDEASVAAALAALARVDILRPEPPLGFVHPLVRAAVYHDLPPGERELRHEAAARLLEDRGAAPEQVAAQLLLAPRRGEAWVADALQEAGRLAMRAGAADSAIAYLTRANAEPPPAKRRGQLLAELGVIETMSNGPHGIDHLREALALLPDQPARGIVALTLARALIMTGAVEEGDRLARAARAELPPELDDLGRALEALSYIAIFFGLGDPSELDGLAAYRDLAEDRGAGSLMLTALAVLDWAHTDGRAEVCGEIAASLLADGRLAAADNGLTTSTVLAILAIADREDVIAAWDAVRADAHRKGSRFGMAAASLWYGFTLYRRGDLDGRGGVAVRRAGGVPALGDRRAAGALRRGVPRRDAARARARGRARARSWSAPRTRATRRTPRASG